MTWNYETIKHLAREERRAGEACTVNSLLALSPMNDPFYAGTAADVENGQWFADLWDLLQCGQGVHLRRVHYRAISQREPVFLPNGTPYENTDACWRFLTQAGKLARYLSYVPANGFVDRRNDEPDIYRKVQSLPEVTVEGDYYFSLSLPEFPDLPEIQISDCVPDQPYQLEIWNEKTTMHDILIPLCQRLGVNLITGTGEISVTHCYDLVKRVRAYGRPCRIFYISDFDPAGQSMPAAASRKIEFYVRTLCPDLDIKLYPLILTAEQCQKYDLPRTPIKESERRAGVFESRNGEGATELDALEALHPGEFEKIVLEAVSHYHDETLKRLVDETIDGFQDYLDETTEYVIDQYQDEIDLLKAEYEEIRKEMEGKVEDVADRIKKLWHAITNELYDQMPASPPEMPEGEQVEDIENPLLDTSREYREQIEAYKRFKGMF